jgi:hypothetical protein
MARQIVLGFLMALLVLPGVGQAYTAAPGYGVDDYASGFPSQDCCGWGPLGLAFDDSDNLYAVSSADRHVYRFQPGGGRVSADTRVTPERIDGGPKGLAITGDGRVLISRTARGDIVELDPATGRVARTVATGLRCPTGLAVDSASGDLFASEDGCGDAIMRIALGGSGAVTRYATGLPPIDGIAFGPDGTLYGANEDGDGQVVAVDGTSGTSPGAWRVVATVPHGDGIAVGSDHGRPFLMVNRNDGALTRVDLEPGGARQTTVLSGGSRGDFVAVDSRGCMYATQTERIVRVDPPGAGCELSPSTPEPAEPVAPGLALDVASAPAQNSAGATSCTRLKTLVLRVRQRGRQRLRYVRVYVSGQRRVTLRNKRVTARIVLRRLPTRPFTVKAVARTTGGKLLKKKLRVSNC